MKTNKKRCCVIGGAGFIGHHIVNRLIKEGHEAVVIDDLSTGNIENIHHEAELHTLDISDDFDFKHLENALKSIDVVFLTAAKARVQPSISDPKTFNKVNIGGTLNVLLAAYTAGVERVVYSASSSCYGNATTFPTPETAPTNPLSPYGLQKYVGEQYCKMFSQVYGLDTVCLRYFNVYGDRMPTEGAYRTAIGIFGQQYKNNTPYTITNDGEQRRDFTHVDDVVDANLRAAGIIPTDGAIEYYVEQFKGRWNGEVFNIGNGNNRSINEVVRMFDENADIEYIGEVLEPKTTLANISKARNLLGWTPKGSLPDWITQYKLKLK